jgi:RNA polymerase sigma-32 factor
VKSKKARKDIETEAAAVSATESEAETDFVAEEEDDESLAESATDAAADTDTAATSETDLVAVSPTDPLRRYLDEVRRYALLEPKEEFDLAMKLKESGDIQAAKTLVSANLRLVVKIAFEYQSMYSNMLDLIQEGNIGLMKAVSKFDPTKGARLGYYASWWIRSYILKYLLDNFRLVKIGTTQAQKKLFYHLMREKERLEAQGLLAGPKLLAEKLDVREEDVIEMEQRLSGRGAELSIDTPIDREGGSSATHGDFLALDEEAADDRLARNQLLTALKDQLGDFEKELNDKERKILQDRLLSEEPKTLQEVADLYGLTRERARQIEAKVIQKLRQKLSKSLRGSLEVEED